jgi:hypothetical protein
MNIRILTVIVRNVTGHAHVVAMLLARVPNVTQPVRHVAITVQADLMNVLHVTVEPI